MVYPQTMNSSPVQANSVEDKKEEVSLEASRTTETKPESKSPCQPEPPTQVHILTVQMQSVHDTIISKFPFTVYNVRQV